MALILQAYLLEVDEMPSLNLIKRIIQLNLRIEELKCFTPNQKKILRKRWERIRKRYARFGQDDLVRAISMEAIQAVITLPKE